MITAIVQARINSTRLPAKVLIDLAGKPMLTQMIERLRRSKRIEKLVIATTTSDRDDPIAMLSAQLGVECFRGSEIDVLNRYYRAASHVGATTVVRLTSDCPLIDPEIVDAAIDLFQTHTPKPDYVVTEGYPRGFDVEVVSFEALSRAWHDDRDPVTREHVTAYIAEHPELFSVQQLKSAQDIPPFRLTVDTLEDYNLVFKIFRELSGRVFGWREVVALLSTHRDWLRLNAHIRQKNVHALQDNAHRP